MQLARQSDESILLSIKKLLGVAPEYDAFDADILTAINLAIDTLIQIGINKPEGFMVEDQLITWDEYLEGQLYILPLAKSFIYLKSRIMFDPPASSILLECLNKQLDELAFRIQVAIDTQSKE